MFGGKERAGVMAQCGKAPVWGAAGMMAKGGKALVTRQHEFQPSEPQGRRRKPTAVNASRPPPRSYNVVKCMTTYS